MALMSFADGVERYLNTEARPGLREALDDPATRAIVETEVSQAVTGSAASLAFAGDYLVIRFPGNPGPKVTGWLKEEAGATWSASGGAGRAPVGLLSVTVVPCRPMGVDRE